MTSDRLGRFAQVKRDPVVLPDALVDVRHPTQPSEPVMIETTVARLDAAQWLLGHMAEVDSALARHGAVLLRGFVGLASESDLQALMRVLGRELMIYQERSTPRRELAAGVYTSTEYPADEEIALHCELTAASVIPQRVWFLCVVPPASGGATPVGDTRRILARIPEPVVSRFRRWGWKLVRNYGNGFGPGWREAFQTDSRRVVEEYCRHHDVASQWRGDVLRTTQVRRAVERHTVTGEEVWFNHVAFWHASSFDRETYLEMVRSVGEDGLPFQVYYGNDDAIDGEDVAAIRVAYQSEAFEQPWRAGDLLVVDNLLAAHGRRPYSGARKIVVAMTDGMTRAAFAPDEATEPGS